MIRWEYALLTLVVLLAAYVTVALVFMFRIYLKFQGERLVTCPETHKPAAVRVAAAWAAAQGLAGDGLRLKTCSRWPERQDCGQQCLSQIEAAPEDCLVWNIIAAWYKDKSCVVCRRPIGEIRHLDRRPALLGPDLKTVQWDAIKAEMLPEMLAQCRPVCWSCHVTLTFLTERPDLVVYRPWVCGPHGYVCPFDTHAEIADKIADKESVPPRPN